MSILDDLPPDLAALLDRFGFDPARFELLRGEVASGRLSAAGNIVQGKVELPRAGDLTSLPDRDTTAWRDARELGLDALREGRVAQIVLAGGMATRFGGVVKGVVEALDGKSFLEWQLGQTARLSAAVGGEIPIALMTSFATDELTREHVAERGLAQPFWFSQFVSLRLTREGGVFRDAEGAPSPYGPGHGDLLEAIRTSGLLALLRDRGVDVVCVSNVDNLGARIDPVVVGAHIAGERPVTIEVAAKEGDMGGAPARVDGRPMLVESFRFPPGFDQDTIPVFNTNTSLIDAAALEQPHELTWLYVEKNVDDREAVQLERLYHEISTFAPTTYLVVPRCGPRGRFFPIKVPEDLERSRAALHEMLATSVLD